MYYSTEDWEKKGSSTNETRGIDLDGALTNKRWLAVVARLISMPQEQVRLCREGVVEKVREAVARVTKNVLVLPMKIS